MKGGLYEITKIFFNSDSFIKLLKPEAGAMAPVRFEVKPLSELSKIFHLSIFFLNLTSCPKNYL
jgi:hypothetical protein